MTGATAIPTDMGSRSLSALRRIGSRFDGHLKTCVWPFFFAA